MTPSAEGRGEGRLPDFFLGGHAKSGTTALYEMLRRHPQIFMPDLKEPLYFATDLRLRFQRPAAGPLPTELSEYLPLFAPAAPGQLAGEASSSYLWSAEAAANIAAVIPEAKNIFILREPAAFLRSLHLQLLQNHIESESDLRKALALEEQRRAGRRIPRRSTRPQALLYSDRVRYVEQLERYRACFPEQQLLVLIYDDFRRENEATVRRVLRFLEVDDTVGVAPTEANPTVRMRSQRLDEMVNAISVGRGPATRALKGLIKAVTPRPLRERALQATLDRVVLGQVGDPEQDVMREIRRRFRHEVVALSEYMDRDLVAQWGYDELD
jgi:hypothetical protein